MRHVDLTNSRWLFPEGESKTGAPRTVYLSETALAITKRLMLRHPHGKLFRNSEGIAWTTDAVNCGFIRIQIRQGAERMKFYKIEISDDEITQFAKTLAKERRVKGIVVATTDRELREEAGRKLRYRKACELAPKYCLYTIRHTWMNRLLRSDMIHRRRKQNSMGFGSFIF